MYKFSTGSRDPCSSVKISLFDPKVQDIGTCLCQVVCNVPVLCIPVTGRSQPEDHGLKGRTQKVKYRRVNKSGSNRSRSFLCLQRVMGRLGHGRYCDVRAFVECFACDLLGCLHPSEAHNYTHTGIQSLCGSIFCSFRILDFNARGEDKTWFLFSIISLVLLVDRRRTSLSRVK